MLALGLMNKDLFGKITHQRSYVAWVTAFWVKPNAPDQTFSGFALIEVFQLFKQAAMRPGFIIRETTKVEAGLCKTLVNWPAQQHQN